MIRKKNRYYISENYNNFVIDPNTGSSYVARTTPTGRITYYTVNSDSSIKYIKTPRGLRKPKKKKPKKKRFKVKRRILKVRKRTTPKKKVFKARRRILKARP